jgi:hypothetical protein
MSDISVVSIEGPSIVVVEGSVGMQGPPGPAGLSASGVEAIAQAEAEELRFDMDALVAATLSI